MMMEVVVVMGIMFSESGTALSACHGPGSVHKQMRGEDNYRHLPE